jgi:hypothetical protein
MHPLEEHRRWLTRRALFRQSGLSLGAMALGTLLARDSRGGENPLAVRPTHFPARAKRVIYLHMVGAPSHLDLFDHKPALVQHDGQLCPKEFIEGKRFAFIRGHPKLLGTRFRFQRYGKGGVELSELLPNLARCADDLTVIKTLRTEEFNHGPAQLFLHTGFGRPGRPSCGSWASYGLGTVNDSLPAYVVLLTGAMAGAGSSLWSNGFLSSVHQGTQFRTAGEPVLFLSNPEGHTGADRRRVLDALEELNRQQLEAAGDPEIAARITQYELAYRMQTAVPELMDLRREPDRVRQRYGAEPGKTSFANNCLLARRLVERGVRFVQLFDADWDHHGNLFTALPKKCQEVDRPIAALLEDLKQRGLLDDTLVIWAGEFGRTPMVQGETGEGKKTDPGRDHHKEAYSIWLAGGGLKGGFTHGKTDELGHSAVENPVHVHDLNATVLHLLGLDHEKLTYRYQGREFRLTDVQGNVIKDILA